MGGVIEKPITRPEGANAATALESCYTGLGSGRSGFDRAASMLSNLRNTSGIWNQTRQPVVHFFYKLHGTWKQPDGEIRALSS